MYKIIILLLTFCLCNDVSALMGERYRPPGPAITNYLEQIPTISIPYQPQAEWLHVPNAVQSVEADWSNAIGKARLVTVDEAIRIAESDPTISYFIYVKGHDIMLNRWDYYFHMARGDAVFFVGEPVWVETTDADGYIKTQLAPF